MGGHPYTGHIKITNQSYHHGWASLQRERQLREQPITVTVLTTMGAHCASLKREQQQRGTTNHMTNHTITYHSYLPPWVRNAITNHMTIKQ
jgi:hypothetical protein